MWPMILLAAQKQNLTLIRIVSRLHTASKQRAIPIKKILLQFLQFSAPGYNAQLHLNDANKSHAA